MSGVSLQPNFLPRDLCEELAYDEEGEIEREMRAATEVVKTAEKQLLAIQNESLALEGLLTTLSGSITKTAPAAAVRTLKTLQEVKGNITAAQGRIAHATRWKELLRIMDQELSGGSFASAAMTMQKLLACGCV